MAAILPRGSSIGAYKATFDATSAHSSLDAAQTESLQKIKVAVPPNDTAQVCLNMRGQCTNVSLLNLRSSEAQVRLYIGQLGEAYLAKDRSSQIHPDSFQDTLFQSRKATPEQLIFKTDRPLTRIPSTQKPQSVLLATQPKKQDMARGLHIAGHYNLVDGSVKSAIASGCLALSAPSLVAALGRTSLGVLQSIIALGSMTTGEGNTRLMNSLSALASNAIQLQASTARTSIDTIGLTYGLCKMLLGTGQHAVAMSRRLGPDSIDQFTTDLIPLSELNSKDNYRQTTSSPSCLTVSYLSGDFGVAHVPEEASSTNSYPAISDDFVVDMG